MPKGKYNKKNPSLRARLAFQKMQENGGIASRAMKDAGFSDWYSKNPQKIMQTKGFIKILEDAGMTDEKLAKKHNALLESAKIEKINFLAIAEEYTDKNKKRLKRYKHIPDDVIIALIESIPGHKFLYIQKTRFEKIAYYKVPDAVVQSRQIEMGYKIKGHFASHKFDVVHHTMTPEEEELFKSLMQANDSDEEIG